MTPAERLEAARNEVIEAAKDMCNRTLDESLTRLRIAASTLIAIEQEQADPLCAFVRIARAAMDHAARTTFDHGLDYRMALEAAEKHLERGGK